MKRGLDESPLPSPDGLRPQLRTAPLKQNVHQFAERACGCLRPQLRTAPLKRQLTRSSLHCVSRLRPQLRTAPLKRGYAWLWWSWRRWSPSSAEDGSIEARPAVPNRPQSSRLRPQLRTAPLKQQHTPTMHQPHPSLRPQLRTAPLKRNDSRPGDAQQPKSPSSAEDGSIEAAMR